MRLRKNFKGKLVWCKWLDSCSRDGWFRPDELDAWVKDGASLCETTGVVIAVTDKVVVIASSVSPDSYGGAWMIPWVHVKDIREIVDE